MVLLTLSVCLFPAGILTDLSVSRVGGCGGRVRKMSHLDMGGGEAAGKEVKSR